MTNIYSRQMRGDTSTSNHPAPLPSWKTSTQSLNNVPESQTDRRKEYDRKQKQAKKVLILINN